MWAAGNKPPAQAIRVSSGLTLLEMLVVVAIIALGTLGVSLALRDNHHHLDREAQRLAALLDAARAQSQATGVPVVFRVSENGFVLEGLPANHTTTLNLAASNTNAPSTPTRHTWLYADTSVQIIRVSSASPADALLLGPEPLIPAQALRLISRERGAQRLLRTDGLRGFQGSSGATP